MELRSVLRWMAGELRVGRGRISLDIIHQEQEIRMNVNHETAQDFDIDTLLSLAEADETLSVEAIAPNRLNSKYALLQESGNN
ncbi:hypothetical protein ACIREE_41520 [Streptomyces sp. NPDC102467]|uniref:hypothetical protein n=1 Tax=Streptomyces sp. NPDC102467 TaxID=3366179 RepID=UPI00382EEEDF